MKKMMIAREASIVYFDSVGADNTDETLKLAKVRASELGIEKIVVATTKGDTAVKAAKKFKDNKIVVVTHTAGFLAPGGLEVTPENRQKIEKLGAVIFTGTHAFGGVSVAVRKTFATYVLGDFMANTLRVFGQGMKVAIEITMMAADAGLVSPDEEIIAIAGTGRGADTAIVVKPAHAHDAFSLRVKEIICKPRL
ncbi:MAG: pyruvate kinase alpha/beta domain-containing protein [bacterium]|nr:pyruvate kinase alpha/beta domain-containing protein [bacterium]